MNESGSTAAPIHKETLSKQVVDRLREAILAGAYGLGSQLNEVEIARQYGISRGPVREAIQRLVQEGLLNSRPHKGVFILDLNDDDLADIYYARNAIEGAALRTVLEAGKGQDVAEGMFEIIGQMETAQKTADWSRVANLDMSFHSLIVETAGSRRLSRMYNTLMAEMRVCLQQLFGGYRGRAGIIESHRRLAEVIAGGRLDPCLRELRAHFSEPVESLRASRKPPAEPEGAKTDRNSADG